VITLPKYANPSPVAHILQGVEDFEAELNGQPISTERLFALGWNAVAEARMRKTSADPWFHWGKQGSIDIAPHAPGWTAEDLELRGLSVETIERLIRDAYGIDYKIGEGEDRDTQVRRKDGYMLALQIAYAPAPV
jgi:hypothetical protein